LQSLRTHSHKKGATRNTISQSRSHPHRRHQTTTRASPAPISRAICELISDMARCTSGAGPEAAPADRAALPSASPTSGDRSWSTRSCMRSRSADTSNLSGVESGGDGGRRETGEEQARSCGGRDTCAPTHPCTHARTHARTHTYTRTQRDKGWQGRAVGKVDGGTFALFLLLVEQLLLHAHEIVAHLIPHSTPPRTRYHHHGRGAEESQQTDVSQNRFDSIRSHQIRSTKESMAGHGSRAPATLNPKPCQSRGHLLP
jgi:hypothetical protein